MKKNLIFLLLILTFLSSCQQQHIENEGQKRISALNKESFDSRIRDMKHARSIADSVLSLLKKDSALLIAENPDFYYNNLARAFNSMAYESFLLSDFESARYYLDKIKSIESNFPEKETELLISRVMKARLLMRLRITWDADSLLDDKIFEKKNNDLLWKWARSQYYVNKLFLNCFYRDGKYQYNELMRLVAEVEKNNINNELMIDETQAHALYYAMANSCQILSHCARFMNQNNEYLEAVYFKKAVEYVGKSMELLSESDKLNKYYLANNYQMLAGIIKDSNREKKWDLIKDNMDAIMQILNEKYIKFQIKESPIFKGTYDDTLVINMLFEADKIFNQVGDPYQILASKSMIAGNYLSMKDIDKARVCFIQSISMIDSIDKNEPANRLPINKFKNTASKMVEQAYHGMVRSQATEDPQVLMKWFDFYEKELHKAFEKEKYDFNYLELKSLEKATKNKIIYLYLVVILVFVAFTVILFFFNYVKHNNKKLKRNKEMLENHKADLESLSKLSKDIVSKLEIDDDEARKNFVSFIYNKVYSLKVFKDLKDFSFILYIKDDQNGLSRYCKENRDDFDISYMSFNEINRPAIGCFMTSDHLFYDDWENDAQDYCNLMNLNPNDFKAENISGDKTKSLMFASLYNKDREKIGVLSFQTTKKKAFESHAKNMFLILAENVASALDNAMQYQIIHLSRKKDIERIASVETCLSIFRHDMSPFITYLQRPDLPEEIKNDALSKLIITLKNTMRWVNLSTPNGLPFKKSCFKLQEVFDILEKSITKVNNDVELIFNPALCEVCGDKNLIEIMLRNLINNALQHTLKGHVKVSASIYELDKQFVKISVEDTGCGIPPDKINDLFRSDKSLSYGHGFGLMLCAYIIKRHDDETLRGCKIWVESQVGKGTTFYFIIAKKY